MEYWDIYDSRRRKTGKTVQRGTPLLPGEYHLVVHICLFGSDGRMLIQRRQPFKAGFPGLWDLSATGSAVAGEDSAQAAQRELSEELGVRIDFADIRPYITFYREYGFVDVYVLTADPGVLCLQEEEVIEARLATEEEICALILSRLKGHIFRFCFPCAAVEMQLLQLRKRPAFCTVTRAMS